MTVPAAPLRVLLVTEDDPLYVRKFFDGFFGDLPRDRIDLVGVTVLRAFNEPLLKTARRVVRFYGVVDFLRILPRFVLVKALGRSIGRQAAKHGFPLYPAASVNAPEYLELVRRLNPEVIVSVAAPEIFRTPLLGMASIGCLNIHSGRIPDYRGMMPTFWQMLEGQPSVVVTVHQMVAKLDAGGVVDTVEFPLLPNDSLDRVISGTKRAGAQLMLRVLARIAETRQMPATVPLDMSRARLFKFPQPEDVARLRARGHRML